MDTAINTTTALVTINASALPTILSADKDDILGKLMAELGNFDPDGSTEAGRKECASKARKVSIAKADLLRLAETLKADAAKVVKGVNAEAKIVESRMDELRDRFLAPVEEYRNREKARVASHEAALAAIMEHSSYGQTETATEIAGRLNRLLNYPARDWQEFVVRASGALAGEINRTEALLAAAEKREAEAAELARLRAEAEARRQREHEEAIAAKARADAEAKAAAELQRQKQEAEAREARAKAEQEARDRKAAEVLAQAERDRQAAVDAAAKAERDRAAAAEKAEQDRIAALAEAKRREHEVAERERAKIAAQQKAEADDRARREKDVENRKAVNRAAVAALVSVTSIDEATARMVITAIAKGQVAGVSITY